MPRLKVTPLSWIFAAFVALALIEYQAQLLLPLERRLSDLFVRLQARSIEPDPDIVVIDIDDRSLERMAELADRWPWPRSVHGELVAGIAAQKPRAIVFDIMFSEPDRTRPESDELFNQLIAPVHNVYFPTARLDALADVYGAPLRAMIKPLGVLLGRDADPDARVSLTLPLALWPENARLGIINLLADSDGVTRRYYLYMPAYGWKIPSLPARVATDLGYRVPEQESLLLGWPAMKRKHVSYIDLYEEFNREKRQRDPAEFKDKIVLVGSAATGLFDMRATPISEFHPGVEILATAIENLKNGSGMRAAPRWVPLVAGLTLMLLVFLAFHSGRHTMTIGAALLIVIVLSVAASYVAAGQRLLLPMFSPVAFVVMLYFGFALHEYLHERRERLKTVDYFGRFVNPHVVKDLLAHGGLSKQGESRQVTVLFSDIRGFTTLSETRSPQEVVALLNRYFGRQVEVIFRYDGCLDKFIGDAIMAFWGAPLDDPEHAKHAVMAALEMGEALELFKRDLGDLGKTFDVGIGLNTGPVVVGIIGSENKREYTAIGDTVNVASRIEGLTKGVARILVSEDTMRSCGRAFDFVDRGLYKVKGRDKDVRLYEPRRKTS